MKKTILTILVCGFMVLGITGCKNKEEQIKKFTNEVSDTYWHWIDTSPTEADANVYCYANIKEDGKIELKSYTHLDEDVIQSDNNDNSKWEIIINKGNPFIKINKKIKEYDSYTYMIIDADKDGNIKEISWSMYLPGTEYYALDKIYEMKELSKNEYEETIAQEELSLKKYKTQPANEKNTISFTNKYGTPSTKCAHAGCNRTIAKSGDTKNCTIHSNKCLKCGKYIDEDAMYCMDCIKSSLR